MQTEYEFDVFISYSHRDKAWVRGELLKRIEKAGLKAFIDFRDFTPGVPSIKECERGVERCRKTLLILTPDYLESGWTEIENIMVQTLDPANRELRLIPLLKAECEKPLRIGALTQGIRGIRGGNSGDTHNRARQGPGHKGPRLFPEYPARLS